MLTHRNDRMLLFLGLMGFLANGEVYSAAPLLINITNDLKISTNMAVLSITSYMIGFGLFTILIGPLGDRFGKAKAMIGASFGSAIFSCLCFFVANINQLIILRFINGAFAAGIMPVSMAIIGEEFNEAGRPAAIAKLMGMMTLGGATATFIGGALSYLTSWRTVYFIYGFAELLIAILLWVVLEQKSGSLTKLNYYMIYRDIFAGNRRLILVLTAVVLTGFSVFGSFTFSGELIRRTTGANGLVIGLILAAFGLGGIAGSRMTAPLRLKTGVWICAIAGIVGCASLFITTYAVGILGLTLSWFGFGIAFILIQSTMIAVAQNTKPSMKGGIMSLVSFFMFLGSSFGTMVNRRLLENFGLQSVFQVAAVIFLIVGLFGSAILKSLKKAPLPYQTNIT